MFGQLRKIGGLLSPSNKNRNAGDLNGNEEKEIDPRNASEFGGLRSSSIEVDNLSSSVALLTVNDKEDSPDLNALDVEASAKAKATVPVGTSYASVSNPNTNPNLEPAMQSIYLKSRIRLQYTQRVYIHCIRHGEAMHKIQGLDRETRKLSNDPRLSTKGIRQVKALAQRFEHMDKITHIICSPMRRTIHTAYLSLYPLIMEKNIPIIAYPDVREWGISPPATGVKMSELLEKFEELKGKVEMKLAPDGWEEDKGPLDPKWRTNKAASVREDLWKLGQAVLDGKKGVWNGIEVKGVKRGKDVHIAVVSHGGFLATLEGSAHQRLSNAEYKTYEFAPEEMVAAGASKFDLVETPASKQRVHDCVELKERRATLGSKSKEIMISRS